MPNRAALPRCEGRSKAVALSIPPQQGATLTPSTPSSAQNDLLKTHTWSCHSSVVSHSSGVLKPRSHGPYTISVVHSWAILLLTQVVLASLLFQWTKFFLISEATAPLCRKLFFPLGLAHAYSSLKSPWERIFLTSQARLGLPFNTLITWYYFPSLY